MVTGKHIDVQEQPLVSVKRTIGLALAGVRYRLFRAIVTVAVIAVAMAFLMNILSESLIKQAVGKSARQQVTEMRYADKWITRLSVPQTSEEILETLSATNNNAKLAADYINFFKNLDYGRRRILVGRSEGSKIFATLSNEESLNAFAIALEQMKGIRFVTSIDELSDFLEKWPELQLEVTNIKQQQSQAIKQVRSTLGNRTIMEALQDATGTFGNTIRSAGFVLDDAEAQALVKQVERTSDMHLVADTINSVVLRKLIAAKLDVMPGDVTIDMIWKMLNNRKTAIWYLDNMQKQKLASGSIDAERLSELADLRAKTKLLFITERITTETGGGFMGIGKRMSWLVLVSMLVCIVGITNAMLMSVTERFREIATLKCLGALDGFIMLVFLIEASVLGLAGGIAGALTGMLLGIIRMLLIFKSLMLQSFPAGTIFAAALLSIATGIILAAVAAVYPSFRAAKLAPMEAMRIE